MSDSPHTEYLCLQSKLDNLAEALVEDILSATDEELLAEVQEDEAFFRARIAELETQLQNAYATAAAIAERRAEEANGVADKCRVNGLHDDAFINDRVEENLTWAAEEIRKLAPEAPNEET